MRLPIIIFLSAIIVACCSRSLPMLEKAAVQGDVDAQPHLAERYFVGDRVPSDKSKANFWFKAAASQGHQYGFYRLAQIYEFGQGANPDIQLAAQYYEKAARLNGADAQNSLARLHASGALCEKDYLASYMWQLLAARHDGLMFEAGRFGAAQYLSEAQQQEAKRAADNIARGFR